MDYEKKYKEALEWMQSFYDGLHGATKEDAEHYFPELKESKDERIRKAIIEFFELQDDNTTYFLVPKKDIIAWLEKQGEKKPAENVEIKFCEGDSVVSNQNGKVYIVGTAYNVVGNNICLHGTDEYYKWTHKWTNKDDLYKNYHLWTIEDAKDGDVLVDSYSKDSLIILYKGINKEQSILAHCGWNGYNFSIKTNGLGYGGLDNTNYLPATKEQRDLLFSKMKEEGYKWDANKKELKKIGPKKLDPDKVIAWLVANICNFEDYVKLFKKDFGL